MSKNRLDSKTNSLEKALPIDNENTGSFTESFDFETEEEEDFDLITDNQIQESNSDNINAELMIEHEKSVVHHSENLSNFLKSIADQLGINENDEEELKRLITAKIQDLIQIKSPISSNQVNTSSISAESIGFLVQNKEHREKRIQELEDEGKEKAKLLDIMEKELERTKQELLDQKNRADALEAINLKFVSLVPDAETWDSAYNDLKEMHEKIDYLENNTNDKNFENIIEEMKRDQEVALDKMQKQMDNQAKLILEYQRKLNTYSSPNIDEDAIYDIRDKVSNTNDMLRSRIQQLNEKDSENDEKPISEKKSQSKSKTPKPIRKRPPYYDESVDKELSECIWMARTREMLALERRINRTDQDIENASNRMHYMTQEKIISQRKILGNSNRQNQTTAIYPSTLL
ncbi:hypothetical protein TVAG_120710 [Trichomonas vaginalis G3]|uniref:Uncharacterized protein n=1 Tax=Trichomonas vaginalis (strain ATCC PRA-98 / G3) TaxID=412133 RepID=A2D7L6_TRIV3|nr:hypothetical protein TVAGG3_0993810 [Trichomonas vaginalis G3]EAY23733.1 hypothetical protein TVAG_120710 [Trichomonas vaginalis G3]KAI5490228.1 hypothetical protein TVAGG3_0993810 [Trichomonas vaginalis G3]|eukprot:XP_001276981.1 hypothetical protein [Trichomonas vaginalis G3]